MRVENPLQRIGLAPAVIAGVSISELRKLIERHYKTLSSFMHPDLNKQVVFDYPGFNSAYDKIKAMDDDELSSAVQQFLSSTGMSARQRMWAQQDEELRRSKEGCPSDYVSELRKLARYQEFLDNYFGNGRIALSDKYTAHFGISLREASATVFYDGDFCHYVDRLGRTRSAAVLLPRTDELDLSSVEERFAKAVQGQAEAYNIRGILRRGERLDTAEAIEGKADRGLFDTSFGTPWQLYASVSPGQVFNGEALAKSAGEVEASFRSPDRLLKAMPPLTEVVNKFDRLILIQVIGTQTVLQKGGIPPVSWRVRITRPIWMMSGPYAINEGSVEGPLAIRDPKPRRYAHQLQLDFKVPKKGRPAGGKSRTKRKAKPIVTDGKQTEPAG